MNKDFDFKFWKRELRDRFDINRTGEEILTNFIYYSPEGAKEYIINLYQSNVEKYDLLDTYGEKYDVDKINSILKQIEFDELTENEIIDFNIRRNEEQEM